MKVEHAIEIADLEHPAQSRFGNNEPKLPVEQAKSFQCTHDHAEPERIDEVDPGEIEHDVVMSLADLRHHLLAKIRTANDIELARDGENRPRAVTIRVSHDLHCADRTAVGEQSGTGTRKPHPCDLVTPFS